MAGRANPILVKLRAAGVARKKGSPPNGNSVMKRWPAERIAALKATCEGEYTLAEIARRFQISRTLLRALIARNGWKRTADGLVLNARRTNARPERAIWAERLATMNRMGVGGRKPGFRDTEETRAKKTAALRARWAGPEREALLERARRGRERTLAIRAATGCHRTRPLPGTPERKTFRKIADALGSAAAHTEIRRAAR